jgi:subtilisin family serine protease
MRFLLAAFLCFGISLPVAAKQLLFKDAHADLFPLVGKDVVFLPHLGLYILPDQHSLSFLAKNIESEKIFPLPEAPTSRRGEFVISGFSKSYWALRAIQAESAWQVSQGLGSKVMVIDTGVDAGHPWIAEKILQAKSFVEEDPTIKDITGHGTHVVGLVAGSHGLGVAPQAKVFVAKVCNNQGCPESAIYQALDWAIANKVDVVNISMGRAQTSATEKKVIEKVLESGITMVAAAGNQGLPNVTYPARLAGVIGVGASDKNNQPADFTNFGAGMDLLAPGVEIFSTYPQDQGNTMIVKGFWGSERWDLSYFSIKGALELQEEILAPLLDVGAGESADYQNKTASERVVLISSSVSDAPIKIKTALAFGAKGFILHHENPQNWDLELSDPLALSGVLIASNAAEQLKQKMHQGVVEVSFSKKATGFQELSGTSMSSALVAGTVALMKAVRKTLSPQQLET